MNVIIPMAGKGARFAGAGHTGPKPLIPVAGVAMLDWALASLPRSATLTIPCQRADVAALSEVIHGDCLVPLDGPTQGAACTVLAAAVGLPPTAPVLVVNCDQYFIADLLGVQAQAMAEAWDGYILTFTSTHPRWSYVIEDADGWVSKVVEKEPVSTHATVGAYWFRRAGDLVWACATAIHRDTRTLGEFYLAPVYNAMIEKGQRIKAVPATAFYGLGTPEDVAAFANLEAHR